MHLDLDELHEIDDGCLLYILPFPALYVARTSCFEQYNKDIQHSPYTFVVLVQSDLSLSLSTIIKRIWLEKHLELLQNDEC